MKYSVIESFAIRTPQGNIVTIPAGRILNLTDEQAENLGGKIRLADIPPPPGKNWQPEFRIWLDGDQLRSRGVCGDLASEIISLTADNLPLQAKLLRSHVGTYSEPYWKQLVEDWNERAAIMEYDGKMSRQEAEYQAAVLLRCVAFLPELRGTP